MATPEVNCSVPQHVVAIKDHPVEMVAAGSAHSIVLTSTPLYPFFYLLLLAFKVAVCLHERSCKVFPKTERRDLIREILRDYFSVFGKKQDKFVRESARACVTGAPP